MSAHQDAIPDADFFAVSLPDLVVLDTPPSHHHRQHCLFIEALGYLGEGDITACEDVMTRLLAINPAHDKVHLLRHALICGIFA